MSDYISREAAIEKIRVAAGCAECAGSSSALCVCNVCDVYNAIRLIKSLPTADVEPVVRRKDCKHLRVWNQKDIYAFCHKTNVVFLPFEKDTRTFSCSFGEANMNGGIENASNEM